MRAFQRGGKFGQAVYLVRRQEGIAVRQHDAYACDQRFEITNTLRTIEPDQLAA